MGFRGPHFTAGRLGYLLSPHWPMWSEALGFMGWGKEDSRGRTGWLHSPHLISERLQELTTHLRPVFDFREGVRKWLPCKHISGAWAQGTPQSQTLAHILPSDSAARRGR